MKKTLTAAIGIALLFTSGFAEIGSLSHLFAPGKTVKDLDGDGFGEKLTISIIIPDNPTASELALAADIAARANLESLAVDFGLVKRISEVEDWADLTSPILIGSSLSWVQEILKENDIRLTSIAPNQGLVLAFSHRSRRGILCVAGSDESLLRTGRAYFLRWPYFWEIWGRETGATYFSLETDLSSFFAQHPLTLQKTVVREAIYEFPHKPETADTLQSLSFDEGQIKRLTVELQFPDKGNRDRALEALARLRSDQRRGLRTAVLSYPGCAELAFELESGKARDEISLRRIGATKRLLTPRFKPRPSTSPAGKEFDLTGLFSTKGFYADHDRDGIADGVDSVIILPGENGSVRIPELASRIMLETAGGSFPLVRLDSEIESRKSLAAPILVGDNELTRDLVRKGRLKLPDLEDTRGMLWVVPEAFGKSGALVFHGADAPGLDKTLAFFARTFPYFNDFAAGHPQLKDLGLDFEGFLSGEKGASESYFNGRLDNVLEDLEGKDIESFEARILLPRPNPGFEKEVRRRIEEAFETDRIRVESSTLKSSESVFHKVKEFVWEVDEALSLIKKEIENARRPHRGPGPLKISLGISESPSVREETKSRIEKILREAGISSFEVEVLSAYKQGFFWLTESILPQLRGNEVGRLLIRFAETREDLTKPKRTYADPTRWLQELYPVDEFLSRELRIPIDSVQFEIMDPGETIYEVQAFDKSGGTLLERTFSPRLREIPFLEILPEWGTVKVTTGWLRIEADGTVWLDRSVLTDLERFWAFYQEDVLRPVYAHILKKTGQEPTFSKQPYFKRLLVEVKLSEPDYRLPLDEEIVSSLEALHDEVYFDTLDFMRGITRFDPENAELPPDASRSSAPGNVMPVIHPSLEGGGGKATVLFEDWPGKTPQMVLTWKEKAREEASKKISFPSLKAKSLRIPGLVFNGREGRIEELFLETDWEKESAYSDMLDILESHRRLSGRGLVADPFRYPNLDRITVRLEHQKLEKKEDLTVVPVPSESENTGPPPESEEDIVTTREIISPAMCLDIVGKLGTLESVRSYVGGTSYEGRDVPVIEMYLPLEKYVSLPRLITFKPTLQLTGRQHANEVSSTNYLLKFVETVAKDPQRREALKKMNFAVQPMENPDGAALAYDLHKIEPFHSLHAGRYSSLGVDIGYRGGSARPLLPEAMVRRNLYNRWLPDIFLNLHGYPSHEWVQPFSNYAPYLFRDYWIPKGWFTYFRSLRLPIYEKWKKAGEDLMEFIIRELQADEQIKASNRKFYNRYDRWAGRWAPHMNALEIYDGVNIYAQRRSSSESRLSQRSQITFSEQTPELMDETATGDWLDFLCRQGLTYLGAHVKYLSEVKFDLVRIDEESRGRVRITFVRGRPGSLGSGEKLR